MSSSSPATLPAPAASPANEDDVSQAGRWMALAAALLGWMFDGAEMGVFSMVGRDAIKNLLTESSPPGTAVPEGDVGFLFGIVIAMFLVGAATGGVLFGWLGDRIGRVRAMTLSVLCYALFTGLTGLATNVWQIAALRFIAALGMDVDLCRSSRPRPSWLRAASASLRVAVRSAASSGNSAMTQASARHLSASSIANSASMGRRARSSRSRRDGNPNRSSPRP